MRIGIDCRSILRPEAGESAGVGHYVHHLVEALLATDRGNEYVLFFDSHDAAAAKRELLAGHPRATARVLPFRTIRRAMPFVYGHMVVASVFERERLDLLHGPANVVPLFYRRPWVVTVHDLAIYEHPEWFPAGRFGGQGFSKRILVPHSILHARRVIVPSHATKADVERRFAVPADRIDVVHEGALFEHGGGEGVLGRHGLKKGGYLLFLGTIEPRKNIAAAVRAFVHAAKRGWVPADAVFAVAGGRGWKDKPVFVAAEAANRELGARRVRFLGYLPREEKHAVIAGAAAFIFPSLYEGFGLPVLEAMAAGVPVIASDTAALAEVCGDAAVLVAPKDEEGMAHALRSVWQDPALADRLRREGAERAASFTWRRAAEGTLAAYRRAASVNVESRGHDVA